MCVCVCVCVCVRARACVCVFLTGNRLHINANDVPYVVVPADVR